MNTMIDPLTRGSGREKGWAGVAALAPGAFALATTEFLPLGLVPVVSSHLHVSLGTAGLMVLVPGLVAAAAAPIVVVGTSRIPRRLLVLSLSFTLLLSNALAMLAPSFAVVLAARALTGVALGGFWAVVPILAAQLVAGHRRARATSFVIAGISAGTVVGLPAGQLIGDVFGWRAAFGAVAALSAVVLAAQVALVPAMPPREGLRITAFSDVLRSRPARVGLCVTVPAIIAQFAASTYVTPFLGDVVHLGDGETTALLLAYGAAGIIGTLLGGVLVTRSTFRTLVAAIMILGVAVILTAAAAAATVLAMALVIAWGLVWGIVPIGLQTWMMSAVPDVPEAASAALVTVFQLSIAGGALAGGLIVDTFGLRADFIVAGALGLASAAYGLARRRSAATA
jgi:predicted MFS family arabinose efflux permease